MQDLPEVFQEFMGKKIKLGGELPKCHFCGRVTSYSYLSDDSGLPDFNKPICLECSREWKKIKRKIKTKNRR